MKPQKMYLADLTQASKNFTVRVKVLCKENGRRNEGKKKFIRLSLVDEKGSKMYAALFGVDVDVYDQIIHRNREYEISNVSVQNVAAAYCTEPDEKQIYFNNSTSVKAIAAEGASSDAEYEYVTLDSIPLDDASSDRFDVVVIPLFVEPVQTITPLSSETTQVCGMFVTNNSTPEPRLVSGWNTLATNEFQEIKTLIATNIVIGISGLKVSRFKGFSLSTTSSTEIILSPSGQASEILSEWCRKYPALIEERRSSIVLDLSPLHPPETMTIKDILSKEASNTEKGHHVEICAYIPSLRADAVRLTLGCSNCGKNLSEEAITAFRCPSCQNTSEPSPKLYFGFKATDGTGTLELAAHTKQGEKILNITAVALYAMASEEQHAFLKEKASPLGRQKTRLVVIPATNLLIDHNMLKWVLKDVLPAG